MQAAIVNSQTLEEVARLEQVISRHAYKYDIVMNFLILNTIYPVLPRIICILFLSISLFFFTFMFPYHKILVLYFM